MASGSSSASCTSHVPSRGFASFQGPKSIVSHKREARHRVSEHAWYLMYSVARIGSPSGSISMRVHIFFMLGAATSWSEFCVLLLPASVLKYQEMNNRLRILED